MAGWQIILAVFFALLPIVLMLDYWGNERLTSRGRPIDREWEPQIRHDPDPDEHH